MIKTDITTENDLVIEAMKNGSSVKSIQMIVDRIAEKISELSAKRKITLGIDLDKVKTDLKADIESMFHNHDPEITCPSMNKIKILLKKIHGEDTDTRIDVFRREYFDLMKSFVNMLVKKRYHEPWIDVVKIVSPFLDVKIKEIG